MVMVAPKITTGSESTSGKNNVSLLEDSEWMAQDDDLLSTLSFSIPSVSLTDSQVSLLVSIPGFYWLISVTLEETLPVTIKHLDKI